MRACRCNRDWRRLPLYHVLQWGSLGLTLLIIVIGVAWGQEGRVPADEIVAVIPGHFPPQYIIDDTGNVTGFAIDVANHVAALAGLTLRYRIAESWTVAADALSAGTADVIPNIGLTADRLARFDFTVPVETFRIALFVRADTVDIRGWDDLAHRKVVVGKTNVAVGMLQARGDVKVVTADYGAPALFALLSGQVDAMVYPEPVAWKQAREAGVDHRLKVVGPPLREVKRGMAVRKGNTALLNRLNRALTTFVASPVYQEIYTTWYGQPTPYWTARRIVITMSGLVAGLMLIMAAWHYRSTVRLNRQLRATLAERQQSEARYRALVDGSLQGISLTKNGTRLFANAALASMYGYDSPEELLGQDTLEHIAPEERARVRRYVSALYRGEMQSSPLEFQAVRRDGTRLWLECLLTLVPWEGERLTMATFVDITARKQAEEALRTRIQELEVLRLVALEITRELDLSTLLALIIRHAASLVGGFESGNVWLWDQQSQELFLTIWPGYEALVPKVRLRLGQGVVGTAAQRREGLLVYDYPNSPHADPFILEHVALTTVLAEPLLYRDELIGVLTLHSQRSFTAVDRQLLMLFATQAAIAIENARLHSRLQKHAAELEERVATRTAELTAKNQELETFAYSVSHDLRTPLRAIHGFAQIIARRHRAALPSQAQRYFDNIVEASGHMETLIDDLLTYSRLGRQAVRRQSVQLGEVLEQTVEDLADRIAATGALVCLPEKAPLVCGDPVLLRQIFTNLLDNALTYCRPEVRPEVHVRCQQVGSEVRVEVADNGLGIAAQHQSKIFEVFQRLHHEDAYPGTGIGLAMVKKAVEMMRGKVWVESQEGQGSTFYVQFPQG